MKRLAAFSLTLLFLFLNACAPKQPPRVALPESERAQVLHRVEHALRSLQAIGSAKGYAKVHLKVRGAKAGFDEVIKIRFPSAFYFETLDDLANTRYVMVSDGARLFWQDYGRKEYWEGDLEEKVFRKFLPLASNLEETLGLFIGKLPPLDLSEAQVFPAEQASRYRVKIPRGEIVWDASQDAIVRLALKAEGARLGFDYEGAGFRRQTLFPTKEADVSAPSRVKLKDQKTKNEIEILYQDLELGIGHSSLPQAFPFVPLPDAKKIDELP